MPHGFLRGRTLRCRGCEQLSNTALAALAHPLWQGKTFHADSRGGYVENNLGPGIPAVRGEVSYAAYPLDGRLAIRIVYRDDAGGLITDWLREVAPGVYAGTMTITEDAEFPWRVLDFALYR